MKFKKIHNIVQGI